MNFENKKEKKQTYRPSLVLHFHTLSVLQKSPKKAYMPVPIQFFQGTKKVTIFLLFFWYRKKRNKIDNNTSNLLGLENKKQKKKNKGIQPHFWSSRQ